MPFLDTVPDRTIAIPSWRFWFGVTGAAIAWAVQGFTCFEIAVQACKNGTGSWGPLSSLSVRLLLGFLSLGFLAVAAAAGIVSYRHWKMLSETRDLMEAEGINWQAYLSLAGIYVSIVCVVGLIWAGLPPIFVDVCNTIR